MARQQPSTSVRPASASDRFPRLVFALHHPHILHVHKHHNLGAFLSQTHHISTSDQERLVQSVPPRLLAQRLPVPVRLAFYQMGQRLRDVRQEQAQARPARPFWRRLRGRDTDCVRE